MSLVAPYRISLNDLRSYVVLRDSNNVTIFLQRGVFIPTQIGLNNIRITFVFAGVSQSISAVYSDFLNEFSVALGANQFDTLVELSNLFGGNTTSFSIVPSLQQVSDVGDNSTNRLKFSGVNYATINEILTKTLTGLVPTFGTVVATDTILQAFNKLSFANTFTEQNHTTGATVTINNATNILYVNPTTLLSSLTITMPTTPMNGQEVKISFGGTIIDSLVVSSLSIIGNVGHTVLSRASITTANSGDGYTLKFESSTNLWRIF